jgi:acetoin utilization deacetylase AcuC-like enzyme
VDVVRTALIYSEQGLKHRTPPGHPECPDRLRAIMQAFDAAELDPPRVEPIAAARADLLRIHTDEHVETIRVTCENELTYPDPDTFMVRESWEAALLAAGGAIEACKAVLEGRIDNAFSAMRPPGHHAEANHAMGFCLFNNVAIAARWLQAEAGVKRVAILDWDVHHGNGTQHAFYDDASVYYASLHQYPHYPGTGRADERGKDNSNLNIPMAAGAPARMWLDAIETRVVPELESFAPDFLLISCGFDAHRDDPLANQNLTADDFAAMTRIVKHLAGGKIVSLLEGGYNLRALGESAVAHFRALREDDD